MRTYARPRHEAPAPLIAVVRPFMRYSPHRDAFVLRGVGNRFGPVIVRRQAGGSDDGRGAADLLSRH